MLRRIEPMKFSRRLAPPPAIGAEPSLRWVDPTSLLVDETYQRDIAPHSRRLIERICERFTWARMKPPVVTEVRAGLHIIDGQHTAIAAATIGLTKLPVFVVNVDVEAERALAFVGHNSDRIKVSAFSIHRALLAAGDSDAVDIANVCKRAGVRLRGAINTDSVIEFGDTTALVAIGKLIKRRGVMKARRILETLVKGERAPIGGFEIYAAEVVLCKRQPDCDLDRLAAAIRAEGDKAVAWARATASLERTTVPDLLADRWIKRMARAA